MTRLERVRLAYVVVGLVAGLAFALMGAGSVVCYVAGVAGGAQLVQTLDRWSRRQPPPRPPWVAAEPRLRIPAPWWAAR